MCSALAYLGLCWHLLLFFLDRDHALISFWQETLPQVLMHQEAQRQINILKLKRQNTN